MKNGWGKIKGKIGEAILARHELKGILAKRYSLREYMYEAILAKHELNEAMIADGAGPHARHSGL